MTIFDDPNRECVGLAPIWTPEDPPPPEGDDTATTTKATKKSRKADYEGEVDDT